MVWLTYRIILALKAAEELKDHGFTYYKKKGAYSSPRIVVSMESLHKWKRFGGSSPVILVMDEAASLCGHLTSVTMANSFLDFKAALGQLASENSSVIAMDAYWTPAATALLVGVFDRHAVIQLGCTPSDRPLTPVTITTSLSRFSQAIVNDITNPEVKGVFLWAGGRKWLDRFLEYLVNVSKLDTSQVMFVHGDSLLSEKRKAGVDPDSNWTEKRVVACTPALTSGVSFTSPGWAVYVIGNPHIFSSAEILMQAAGRVRQPSHVMFTVLEWEKASMMKLPETIDGIKRMVGNYKMSKFTHIRRFLGLSILESEGESAIVRQMFDGPFSNAILMHLLTIFKDHNDPFKYLEDKLDRTVFDVRFDGDDNEDIDIYQEDNSDRIANPGFYQYKGIEVLEQHSFDAISSSDCLSASLDQCSELDFLSADVEPENFILDENTQMMRWPSMDTFSKFRALDVKALKGFFNLFCTLGLFGNAFSDPYKDHDIKSIEYITQMGKIQVSISEVYAVVIKKNVISEREFARLWRIYWYDYDDEDFTKMIKEYNLERRTALPTMNPSETLEDIIMVQTLRAINYDFRTMSIPGLVSSIEYSPELYRKFKEIANVYDPSLESAKLPLIKFLVLMAKMSDTNPDSYAALKLIGKIVQATCNLLGIPSPLGDLRKLVRGNPYYAQRSSSHPFRRAFISYCLRRKHLMKLGVLRRVPSAMIPTLFYRMWIDIPECATLSEGEHENSMRFIDQLPYRTVDRSIESYFPCPVSDPFEWVDGVLEYEGRLSVRATEAHRLAPRRTPADKEPVNVLGKVVVREHYDEMFDWVLILDGGRDRMDIDRLKNSGLLNYELAKVRFAEHVFYMRKLDR